MQPPYNCVDPAWLALNAPIMTELGHDRNFAGVSSTNGMVLPEQDQPTRDVYETYPGSEINGQLHGIALRTVGSFEHSQPQSFGTEVIEFTNFPPLNVVQLQEQDLVDSSEQNYHPGAHYRCLQPTCSISSHSAQFLHRHTREEHPDLLRCAECGTVKDSTGELESHAWVEKHAAFLCPEDGCDSTFTRIDVMRRHNLKHTPDARRYPCPHCKKYRGKTGFKRMDHLTQHLRGYHHIREDESAPLVIRRSCPHTDCFAYRGLVRNNGTSYRIINHAFQKQSDWTAHMKSVHDESPFPCTVPGCGRTGGKGYYRERDLKKHISKEHHNYTAES